MWQLSESDMHKQTICFKSPTNKLRVLDSAEQLLMYLMAHKKTVLPQYILSSQVQKYQLWVVNIIKIFIDTEWKQHLLYWFLIHTS